MNLAIVERPSPNFAERPAGVAVDTLVLHYTGMESGEAAVARLCDTEARVSSHYVVDEAGGVLCLVGEERVAYHAGVSCWRGARSVNLRSVGIEIVNPGHDFGYPEFPPAQMAAVAALCREILARHPIPARNVVGHADVAPHRKQDPGEKFDWRGLARQGIGLWPEGVDGAATGDADDGEVALKPVRAALALIGYEVAPAGGLDAPLGSVLRAFQRHWRGEAVTGLADRGTRARIEAVATLCAGG